VSQMLKIGTNDRKSRTGFRRTPELGLIEMRSQVAGLISCYASTFENKSHLRPEFDRPLITRLN
jgi:hypothetical protein